jgi:hypothetical protein
MTSGRGPVNRGFVNIHGKTHLKVEFIHLFKSLMQKLAMKRLSRRPWNVPSHRQSDAAIGQSHADFAAVSS